MKRIPILCLCILFMFTFLGAGCGQAAKKPVVPQKPNVSNKTTDTSDKRVMANRLATMANNVDGVSNATVVVESPRTTPGVSNPLVTTDNKAKNQYGRTTGKTATRGLVAMVGITLSDSSIRGTDREKAIKENVRKRLLSGENKLSEVLVTTDPSMVKKIKDVAAGVLQGRPTASDARNVQELDKMMRQGK